MATGFGTSKEKQYFFTSGIVTGTKTLTMKNIILAATLLVALSSATFAKEKNMDPKLYRDLSATLENSRQICWINKPLYKQAMFSFNDQTACAFYSANDNEFIGFGILSETTDLPEIVTNAIKNKYGDWQIVDAMMFIDKDGYINYFAQVKKNNKDLAIKITPNGRLSVYASVPSE
jgi:hypothetical protein